MIFLQLYWSAPITRNEAKYYAIGHRFSHLKHLEIGGYRGLVSDFQIALYMIGNAAGTLKKIVIDPSIHPYDARFLTTKESLKIKDASRSHARTELSQCMPPWVELAVLHG